MASVLKLPRPPRAVDAIVERVRRGVLEGEFPAGETLPPERDLASSLGVSRLTLRAALGRLETEGLLRARQGDGVRVLDVRAEATLAILPFLPKGERNEAFRSFLELRRALACEAVALACSRASEADIAELESLAAAQRAESDDERYIEGDLAFSRRVLVAADNLAMVLLFNTLVPVYRAHPELGRALVEHREASLAGYTFVTNLLCARDADRARHVLRAVLEAADAFALDALRSERSTPDKSPSRTKRSPHR